MAAVPAAGVPRAHEKPYWVSPSHRGEDRVGSQLVRCLATQTGHFWTILSVPPQKKLALLEYKLWVPSVVPQTTSFSLWAGVPTYFGAPFCFWTWRKHHKERHKAWLPERPLRGQVTQLISSGELVPHGVEPYRQEMGDRSELGR